MVTFALYSSLGSVPWGRASEKTCVVLTGVAHWVGCSPANQGWIPPQDTCPGWGRGGGGSRSLVGACKRQRTSSCFSDALMFLSSFSLHSLLSENKLKSLRKEEETYVTHSFTCPTSSEQLLSVPRQSPATPGTTGLCVVRLPCRLARVCDVVLSNDKLKWKGKLKVFDGPNANISVWFRLIYLEGR